MLDINFIRNNPEKVRESLKNRNKENLVDIYEVLSLDNEQTVLERKLQNLYNQRNNAAKSRNIEEWKIIKTEIKELENQKEIISKKLLELLLKIPNIPMDDVPIWKDENENKILKRVWEIPQFSFTPKPHEVLGKELWIINTEKASDVAWSRFNYLIWDGALLEKSLQDYARSILTDKEKINQIIKDNNLNVSDKAFIPVSPPNFINPETFLKMARLEPQKDRYFLKDDNLFLIGSAEHTLWPIHMWEIIPQKNLPIRYFATTSCYRKEAWTYGKDMKWILRQHQFNKVEMLSYSNPQDSFQEHLLFVAIQEYLVKSLWLPYQKVLLCTWDMWTPDVRHVDIEIRLPWQNKYRETHSADYNTDYQSRRLNIRTITDGKKEFVHLNDWTAYALWRMIIAILENNQQEDWSILIPQVLQPYMWKEKIVKKSEN